MTRRDRIAMWVAAALLVLIYAGRKFPGLEVCAKRSGGCDVMLPFG